MVEPTTPTVIGSGSLATVYSLQGLPIVFKVARSPRHSDDLRAEFHTLRTLHTRCDPASLFTVPRPIAYYDPNTDTLERCPPPPSRRARDCRPIVDRKLFTANGFDAAAYAMDRIHVLPVQVSTLIRDLFCGGQATVGPPRMCPLYFGDALGPSGNALSPDLPLDVARYTTLRAHFGEGMLTLEDVASGMGDILSQIHWSAGYDARGVKFVMAGTGIGVRYYAIHFHHMRTLADDPRRAVEGLLDALFNDPYCPWPAPGDALYHAFRSAYLAACPEERRGGARAFLRAIECGYTKISSR